MDYHSVFLQPFHQLQLLAINSAATTILLFALLVLFVLSFFIAGSEVAFFSLSSKDINVLKTKKQPSFRRIVNLLEQPKILLASMLIANSFINIGIILISNLLISDWLGYFDFTSWGVFIIKVLAITFLLMLFAEVLPKVWAIHHKVWFAATASLIV